MDWQIPVCATQTAAPARNCRLSRITSAEVGATRPAPHPATS